MMESWSFHATTLSAPDFLVLAISIAVLLFIGFFVGSKEDTTAGFFLGNRRIPIFAACLSFVATEISAVTIISVPATAYKENWLYLQFFIGSFAARIFLAFFFIPAFYKYNCTTIYDFLRHRFGLATQLNATFFFFITRLLASGVRLTVAVSAVSILLGWPFVPTLILFSIISMLYISWGGIKAIIWTNVWQALSFIIGGIATLIFLSHMIDGGLWQGLQIAFAEGKLRLFEKGPAWGDNNFWGIILSNPNIWWLAILNGFFGSMAAYGTDHELMQRLLTVETREKSQKTTLLTPVVGLGVMMLYLLIGASLFAFYKTHAAASLPLKLDDIYPHFVSSQMPALLRGLILSVVVLASIDSPLGSLSASFVNDFYRPLMRRGKTDAHYLKVARSCVIVFGIVLGYLAFSFSRLEGFLWWAFKIGGITYGSLLGVFLLGLLTKRSSNIGNVIGMITMAIVNLTLLILTEKHIINVGWTWLVLIGTFGTMLMGALFSQSPRPQTEGVSE